MSDDAPAKPTRIIGTIDLDAGTVTLGSRTYSGVELPQRAAAYMGLHGLRHHLQQSADAPTAYGLLCAGVLPGRRPAPPKPLEPIRQAIANALVERSRKAGSPITQADADARARALDKAQVELGRADELVARHHRKIAPPAASLLDQLLAPSAGETVADEAA